MPGDYLDQELVFHPDRIEVKASGELVMMAWELPLMTRMAEIAAMRRGRVLEVGFGMGLSAQAVQRLRPQSHTIIEAHPQVLERARAWAAGRAGVSLVAGRWQEVLDSLGPFDGISFDVFGGDGQRREFFTRLHRLLAPAGVATLWLGDERVLPPELAALLAAQGFCHHLTRVTAIPDPRCTYSRTNEFYIPIVYRPNAGASLPEST